MKTLLSVLFLCLCNNVFASSYYVSTSGSDTAVGSLVSPFKTVAKAMDMVVPGDTVYIRGGEYPAYQDITVSGTQDSPITITSYNNETVVFLGTYVPGEKSYDSLNSSESFYIRGNWLVIKNLEFSHGCAGFYLKGGASNNRLENLKSHDNYYTGFVITQGASYNTLLNCDAYRQFADKSDGEHGDGYVFGGGNTPAGEGNVVDSCRSWGNCDDGFDCWKAGKSITFIRCMSFRNGIDLWGVGSGFKGNGNGYKLGIHNSSTSTDAHVLKYCLAWGNPQNGFDYNDSIKAHTLYNCTSYNNGRNYKFYNINGGPSVDIMDNNISAIATQSDILLNSILSEHKNSWNIISRNASNMAAQFKSLDDTIISGDRNSDGSIVDSDFLKLADTSVFIDSGVDVGLPFNGTAPDMGAFESSESSPANSIGMTSVYANTTVNSPARAVGPFEMPADATIDNITIYHNGDQGSGYTFKLAVYADNDGVPGERLAISRVAQVGDDEGWQTLGLTHVVNVAQTDKIWLAWKFSTNPGLRYVSYEGEPVRYDEGNDELEAFFVASQMSDAKYSIYASYTTPTRSSTDNYSFASFASAWQSSVGDPNWNDYFDIDGSGTIDQADLRNFADLWLIDY